MIYINTIENVIEQGEKLKGYWDETGLDMHIAVKKDGRIAVSTKHWSRVHYIRTQYNSGSDSGNGNGNGSGSGSCGDSSGGSDVIWEKLSIISKNIGRTLIKSKKGDYVYINKLNKKQTQKIFDRFKEMFGDDVIKVWEFSWDIDDAVLPQW